MIKYFCIQHGFRLSVNSTIVTNSPLGFRFCGCYLRFPLLCPCISSDSKSHPLFRMPSTFARSIHLQWHSPPLATPHLTAGLSQPSPNPSLHPRLSPLQFSPLKHRLTGIQEIFVISLGSFKLFSTSNWNCHPSKIPLAQLSKQRSSPSSMVRDQNSHALETPHPSTSLHVFIHRLPPTRKCSSTWSLYRNHTCSSSSTEI